MYNPTQIEAVIKNLPTKSTEPEWFQCRILQEFERRIDVHTQITPQNTNRTLHNLFHKATDILVPNPHKDSTKK